MNTIRFVIKDPRAVIPTKAHPSDVGYDLTAISIFKQIDSRTTLYDTGLAMSPPDGYYLEILPRSSLSKTGYMLSNSVGVIDPQYTGSLLIALTEINEINDGLELPFCKCQLVVRKAERFELEQVESLVESVRGDGGFGSSDAQSPLEPNLRIGEPFQPLIDVLTSLRDAGNNAPLRSTVASSMGPNVVERAGVKTIKQYMNLAVERGIVTCSYVNGQPTVSLV